MNVVMWSKETLKYKKADQVAKYNKKKIVDLIDQFKLDNPELGNNFYVLGTASLILQNQLAKKLMRDVDIYCEDYTASKHPDAVDIVKNDVMPVGWKDRVVNIDGINCISIFDVACTLALSYEKKPLRKALLLWLLRDLDLEQVKCAMKEKLDSGIGVTESDFKHYDMFCKEITQRLIDLNRNPQAKLIEILEKEEENIK